MVNINMSCGTLPANRFYNTNFSVNKEQLLVVVSEDKEVYHGK